MNKPMDAVVVRYASYAVLFALAAYALFCVRGVLPIFAVALLLAYAFEPMLRRMESQGRSRALSVSFVAIVFLLLMALVVSLLAAAWQQLQELTGQFPVYQSQVTTFIDSNRYRLEKLPVPENVRTSALQALADAQSRAPALLTARLQGLVTWVFSSLGSIGIAVVVVPILTLYFMLEMNALRARSLMLVPASHRRDVIEIGDSINELLGRYVRGQMIVCGLFGTLCTICFYVLSLRFGMGYPLVLGLCAIFLYIIPYIGMALIAASAGLTAYLTADTAPMTCAAIAVGSCLVFNLVIDYGISPRVLGRGVGLHPILVIFALLSGAQVAGVAGMVLAVPTFASLRVIAIYLFPQLAAPLPEADAMQKAPAAKAGDMSPQTKALSDASRGEQRAPNRRGLFAWFRREKA